MSQEMEVKGLDELIDRMKAYPAEMTRAGSVAMNASLNTLWENVPAYPAPPEGSRYVRTGTLGKSLGSGMGGGASGGSPSVYRIKRLGDSGFEGEFGTNLNYAEYVIGEEGQQSTVHAGRWWTIKVIAEKSADKIEKIWIMVAEKLAAFLDGKGKSG
jgi:hypothetical protein